MTSVAAWNTYVDDEASDSLRVTSTHGDPA
jgi:hypothetical protein